MSDVRCRCRSLPGSCVLSPPTCCTCAAFPPCKRPNINRPMGSCNVQQQPAQPRWQVEAKPVPFWAGAPRLSHISAAAWTQGVRVEQPQSSPDPLSMCGLSFECENPSGPQTASLGQRVGMRRASPSLSHIGAGGTAQRQRRVHRVTAVGRPPAHAMPGPADSTFPPAASSSAHNYNVSCCDPCSCDPCRRRRQAAAAGGRHCSSGHARGGSCV